MMEDFEFKEPAVAEIRSKAKPKAAPKPALAEKPAKEVQLKEPEPKYAEEELDVIFDALMFEGSYQEEVKIGKRMSVTFRTRNGKDAREVMERLDKSGYQMGLTLESIRALYNLAQSVMAINSTDLSGETFDRKVERLESLPSAVIATLLRSLTEFDIKVEAAVRHGEENF